MSSSRRLANAVNRTLSLVWTTAIITSAAVRARWMAGDAPATAWRAAVTPRSGARCSERWTRSMDAIPGWSVVRCIVRHRARRAGRSGSQPPDLRAESPGQHHGTDADEEMGHLHQPMHWPQQETALANAKAEHQKTPGDGGRDERESDA